jgi:hypothetical protein
MIKLGPSHITDIDRGRKFFENIQDPDEYRAAASAIKFRDQLYRHARSLSDYECCFEPGSSDWEYMKALYNSVLDAHFERTERSQKIREQAWVSADRVLSDALSEFTQAKGAVQFMDRIYRQQSDATLRNSVGRNLKLRYKETVKSFLKTRRECLRAKRQYEYALEQSWKRNPHICPRPGWVWIPTHRRVSRTGRDYVVDGYWRAPRKDAVRIPTYGEVERHVKDAVSKTTSYAEAAQLLNEQLIPRLNAWGVPARTSNWTSHSVYSFCERNNILRTSATTDDQEPPVEWSPPRNWSNDTILDNGKIVAERAHGFNGIIRVYDGFNNVISTERNHVVPSHSEAAARLARWVPKNSKTIVVTANRRFIVGVRILADGSNEIHWSKHIENICSNIDPKRVLFF